MTHLHSVDLVFEFTLYFLKLGLVVLLEFINFSFLKGILHSWPWFVFELAILLEILAELELGYLDEAVMELEVSSSQSLRTFAALDLDKVADVLQMSLEFLLSRECLDTGMAASVFCAF